MAYSKRSPLKFGDVFESNHWGTVQVIEYRNAKEVDCVFDNTGNVGTFHAQFVRSGHIADSIEQKRAATERKAARRAEVAKNRYDAAERAKNRSRVEIGDKVFESEHCGPFEVVNYRDANNVTVRFRNTGYETETTKAALLGGDNPRIRDPLAPTVFGKGYQGIGGHLGYVKTVETQPHAIWRAMLRRCYGPEHRAAYADVTVCAEWLNFQTFADWYEDNHPGAPGLELDKDIKIPGNRVYGPHACQFVTRAENLAAKSR